MRLNEQVISKITGALDQARILVVGDVMLDKYWFGEVKRISPEAPVPIAKIDHTENRPGGAANVARNVASLGGTVTLLSIVGKDEAANELYDLLKHEKVHTLFERDENISTIVKLRVLAKNQQLIRVDFEEKPSNEILLQVLERYSQIIGDHDVIILSDYAKGGLEHTVRMIKLANHYNKPILIDPKGTDYTKYANATLITPNRQELSDAVGSWNDEQELQTKVLQLKQQLNLSYILLTRSEEGMTLYKPETAINYRTVAREIYDVSGAGDTVIATLGLMLANKINIEQAVMIANIAAGIVVAKVGTAKVTKTELIDELQRYNCGGL